MSFHNHGHGRRLTLRERLQRLNDSLADLGRRLRESIANVIGSAVADAAGDAVRMLLDEGSLANADEPYGPRGHTYRDDRLSDRHSNNQRGGWDDELNEELPEDRAEHGLWSDRDDGEAVPTPRPTVSKRSPGRLGYAITTALAAGAWWLNRCKPRRPVLTAVAVAVAAGITALIGGPAVIAGLGVVSSLGGLLRTANAVGSATAELNDLAND